MGHRFVWMLIWERDGEEPREWSGLLRWAIVGLAVIGVAAVIVWRLLVARE